MDVVPLLETEVAMREQRAAAERQAPRHTSTPQVVQGQVAPVQNAPQATPVIVQQPAPVYVQEQPSVVYVQQSRPAGPALGRAVLTGVVAGRVAGRTAARTVNRRRRF